MPTQAEKHLLVLHVLPEHPLSLAQCVLHIWLAEHAQPPVLSSSGLRARQGHQWRLLGALCRHDGRVAASSSAAPVLSCAPGAVGGEAMTKWSLWVGSRLIFAI